MLTNYNNQFPRESFRKWNPNQCALLIVERQRSNWDEADAHSQGNEIDDQIKIIELHGWLDAPAFAAHPGTQSLAGVGVFIDQQPVLFLQPFNSRFCF